MTLSDTIMTQHEELDRFLSERVWGSKYNNGNPREIVLGKIEVVVFDDGHCALQIGKAIIGRHSFIAFELGTGEEYDEWLRRLIAEEYEALRKNPKGKDKRLQDLHQFINTNLYQNS